MVNNSFSYSSTNIIRNHSPFGMVMPGRSNSSSAYRFGFNGIEKDDEIKGSGNSIAFGSRMYDSRTGRWLSVDPLQKQFSAWSPYTGYNDSPILMQDPSGKGAEVTQVKDKYSGKVVALKVSATIYVYSDIKEIQDNIQNHATAIQAEIIDNFNINALGEIYVRDNIVNVPIVFDVKVLPAKDGSVNGALQQLGELKNNGSLNGSDNFIHLNNTDLGNGNSESFTWGNNGTWSVNPNTKPNVRAHEFAHLLGFQSKANGIFDKEDFVTPISIMHSTWDRATPYDIKRLNYGAGVGLKPFPETAKALDKKAMYHGFMDSKKYIGAENTNKIVNNVEEGVKASDAYEEANGPEKK